MLRWAILSLILALVAAVFGFGGIAAAFVDVAQILFFVFIVLFILATVVGVMQGRRPPMQ